MDGRIAEFVDELLSPGGASIVLFASLREDPPPGAEFSAVLAEALPRASTRGVIDGTTLALCLSADPRYRPIVEGVIAEGRLPADKEHGVYYKGAEQIEGDALLWWFDLLHSRCDRRQEMHTLVYLIANHPAALAEHRRENVITLLSGTTRGAGRFTLDAVAGVLRVVGRCAPLERQWSGWIRDGLVDGRTTTGPDPSISATMNVRFLERLVDEGPFPDDWALVDETTAHWREMLADQERRTAGLYSLGHVMLDRRTLLGRLPDAVMPALTGTAEARPVEEGFRAIARGDKQHAADIARQLLDQLGK